MSARTLQSLSSAHLTAALLFTLLSLVITQVLAGEVNTLPDLGGAPTDNTVSMQPNINGQGAGFNYRDTIDGKLISINPQYTKQNGITVGGSLASPLSKSMAVGILLTAGSDKNEWLLNAGFDLSNNQRFIFSLGQLRQKLDFNFISGSQETSVRQDNIAGSYQYFLGKDWLNAAEVNAYLSNTGSITLGDKTYFTDTTSLYELWSDPRRIAGGRVTGMQTRLVFTPASKTNIKVGIGVERLTYNYLAGDESTNRATGSAELVQGLAHGFNFRASANAASSQNRYTLGLGRNFKDGAQLSIDVARIQGRDSIFNDTQLLLSYTQSFGGAQAGMGRIALNSDAPMEPVSLGTVFDNAATSNQATNTWASALVSQVAQRPSFLPSQVVAKIDTTAAPTRLIAISKLAVPAGSTINTATGAITSPTGIAVSGITGVTKNTLAFANSGQFTLSGSHSLVINPGLITQPAVGVIDTYVVTMNNSAGGGTTLATVKVSHGSTSIDSIEMTTGVTVINTAAITGVTAPVTGATPVGTVSGAGYTGAVTWSGSPSTFAASTVYTATVTLTAASGYTLTGVAANYFTVSGATATNSVNSGEVSAVFPATAAALPWGYVMTQNLGTGGVVDGTKDASSSLDGSGTLIWTGNQVNGGGTYYQAAAVCGAMNTRAELGYSDWRLPTQQELSGMANGDTSALPADGWATGNGTWSSTVVNPIKPSYYVVYLSIGSPGGINVYPNNWNYGRYMSCVHEEL
jgi:hypothetical protein